MRLLTLLVSVLALLQLGRLQDNDSGQGTNIAKTQTEEMLMNAITSINDTLACLKEDINNLTTTQQEMNQLLTDRLNSQLRKMDAAKTQSEEESTSLMNAITSINDTLACLKEDVNHLTTTQQQTGGAHNPAASCRDIREHEPDSTSKYYWIRDSSGRVTQQYCDMQTGSSNNPAASCRHILEQEPNSTSKYCWIRDSSGRVTQQYCDMEREGCGTRGGWMRVAHLDMTQPNQQCPSGFSLITSSSKRLCGRPGPAGCVSVKFSTNGIAYNKVCGKVIAYQDRTTDGMCPYIGLHTNRLIHTIEEVYIDGVSITHGTPRQHIWSFIASLAEDHNDCHGCPCYAGFNGNRIPFIGNNFFCDSAVDTYREHILYTDDPLWDGEGCGSNNLCCSYNNPPWFCTELDQSTSDDIELRLCGDEINSNDDVPIEHIELYVQ